MVSRGAVVLCCLVAGAGALTWDLETHAYQDSHTFTRDIRTTLH